MYEHERELRCQTERVSGDALRAARTSLCAGRLPRAWPYQMSTLRGRLFSEDAAQSVLTETPSQGYPPDRDSARTYRSRRATPVRMHLRSQCGNPSLWPSHRAGHYVRYELTPPYCGRLGLPAKCRVPVHPLTSVLALLLLCESENQTLGRGSLGSWIDEDRS